MTQAYCIGDPHFQVNVATLFAGSSTVNARLPVRTAKRRGSPAAASPAKSIQPSRLPSPP
jgi:hypothetical protein